MADYTSIYHEITTTLIQKRITIATAESVTGGMIASLLTDTEGASAVFKGGFVTYSNEAKTICGVPADIIRTNGVYSPQTAQAMAQTARTSFSCDIGIGVTGTLMNKDPANADSVPGHIDYCIDYKGTNHLHSLTLPATGSRLEGKQAIVSAIGSELLTLLST